ncbi:MAG: GxxExxY protein [Vicinamibacterales bacterium]
MQVDPSAFNSVTHAILGAAIEVHRTLGPGLLESIYLRCLQWELDARQQRLVSQHSIPIIYKGAALDSRYRIDLIVDDLVVVEVKAVSATHGRRHTVDQFPSDRVRVRLLQAFFRSSFSLCDPVPSVLSVFPPFPPTRCARRRSRRRRRTVTGCRP